MIQRGNGAPFALDAVTEIGLAREVAAEHLDRDSAAQASVAREVDLGHAALAELSLDAVGSQRFAHRKLSRAVLPLHGFPSLTSPGRLPLVTILPKAERAQLYPRPAYASSPLCVSRSAAIVRQAQRPTF